MRSCLQVCVHACMFVCEQGQQAQSSPVAPSGTWANSSSKISLLPTRSSGPGTKMRIWGPRRGQYQPRLKPFTHNTPLPHPLMSTQVSGGWPKPLTSLSCTLKMPLHGSKPLLNFLVPSWHAQSLLNTAAAPSTLFFWGIIGICLQETTYGRLGGCGRIWHCKEATVHATLVM